MFFFPFFPFCSHFAKHVIKMQKYKPLFPLPKSESANLSYCCSRQSWDNQVFHSVQPPVISHCSQMLTCLPRPSVTRARTQEKNPFGNSVTRKDRQRWQDLSQWEL